MKKFYFRLYTVNNNFKKQFLSISFLFFLMLYTGTHANAQCPVVNVTPATSCGGVAGAGPCNLLTASGNADTYVWSPLAGLYTNCTHTIPYTGTNTTTVYAAPTFYTEYTVTGTILASGCSTTATARVNYTPPAPIVTPNPAVICLGDPAIKLKVLSTPNTAQFCSGPLNIPVADNNPAGASNNIAVSGLPANSTITEINVTINMTHTRIGNMVFVLRAPNGQILNLDYHLTASGGTGPTTGFVNTIISSAGITALSAGVNPYTGTFKPDLFGPGGGGGFGAGGPTGMLPTATTWAPLYSVPNGNWTLGFYDGITGDVGILTSWCLGINYTLGILPATPAVWTPAAGLFMDPAATIPYIAGTQRDSVWARPTPAGVYSYQVTTQGLPPTLCTTATNFVSNNSNSTITFNVKNNHPYPIRMLQIDSRTLAAGTALVYAYYKTSAINGPPGAISAANGWVQFGAAAITGTGSAVQPFISNLQFVIPAGASYGICLQAITITNAPNLSYSTLSPGNYSFNDGGCEIITGTNIGYSGINIPSAPTITPAGFIGAVHFAQASPTCTSPPRTVVVTVGQAISITQQPVNQAVCVGNSAGFSVAMAGAGPFIYQWQQSSSSAGPWTNIVNGGIFSGALTNTLLINTPPVTMSGYLFRVSVNGGSGCSGATSAAALLTVYTLPNIVITANPLIIGPGQTTTIFSTVTPNPAATYTWYYNGTVLPGATADTLLVDISGLGDYQLKVTDVNGCTDLSNIITIVHSFALTLFTYPNPSAGMFQVRYYSETNSALQRSLTVYNNRGERISTQTFTQTIPYQKIDIDIRAHGKGLYWIELRDAGGKRLAVNRAVVQ
ncbi:MAG: T9SS type A sorting domain-containing protein [Chitinophagaceae bacterium]|nr:T9SS type A sorting domain-containing protein [Chitinophagaceae bacterium]